MTTYKIGEGGAGKRLDAFAVGQLPMLSRSSVQKLIEDGRVQVNRQLVKHGHKLSHGDRVTIDFDPKQLQKIPKIDLPVLYEDDDCVVINKPAGILSHSKGNFNPEPTVASWMQSRLNKLPSDSRFQIPDSTRLGIVHRLDRATSGVMICAKTPEALAWLQKQFSQRKVKKNYIAIVKGQPEPAKAVIDMPIERHPKKPQTFRVGPRGKSATTRYEVSKRHGDYSLLTLAPQTGRTHQLRVHLAKLGFPIVGDKVYGGQPAERLFLHALSLEITLPSKERRTFEALLPAAFRTFVK